MSALSQSCLSDQESRLIAAIQDGLPLTPRPYADLAAQLGVSEGDIIQRLNDFLERGIIKRLGVVVRHRELGYMANGMVVWDVPDDRVDDLGVQFRTFEFVTLCYRRPRQLPDWPYNLFCMIHGQNRAEVIAHVGEMIRQLNLNLSYDVLFSRRCFKQRGARYSKAHDAG